MKKCDLHIHTVPTVTDSLFTFSMDVLKDYVAVRKLDVIAITNHNTFDRMQYDCIKTSLVNTVVLPGIEIDVDGGHVILITDSDNDSLNDFESKCSQVTPLINNQTDYIPFNVLYGIFHDFSKYLIIPHVEKEPALPKSTVVSFASNVKIGEVGSHKKFVYAIKNDVGYTPVLFSDFRASTNVDSNNYPVRQTYIDIQDVTVNTLKISLSDKAKVGLAPTDGHDLFSCFSDGQCLSTGLNIVLGKRSSGKTFTLQRICNHFSERALHIKQFELLKDQDSKSLSMFDAQDKQTQEHIAEAYLSPFKEVVRDAISVPTYEKDMMDIENYLNCLHKFAKEENLADVYSKTRLYNENTYRQFDIKELEKLIKSTANLLESTKYKDLIGQYLTEDLLRSTYCALVDKYRELSKLNRLIDVVNTIISDTQTALRMRSSATVVPNLDLYSCLTNSIRRSKFCKVVDELKKGREISRRAIGNFSVLTTTRPYRNATDLEPHKKVSLTDAFSKYDKPFEYLQKLKDTDLSSTTYHLFFSKIEYKILNSYGHPVSGGERTEFNFLQRVKDAMTYDILIIDEPESSFDNVFLKNQVNTLIKEMAQLMPVVVSTHNNTIGSSIKPDFILYTEKTVENGEPVFRLYSGHPGDKELTTIDGHKVKNYTITLDSLEAGEDAYKERRHTYEILED